MSTSNCRRYLETSLASLLGFDIEDVVDVIEHLLTFESKDDLLEHLSALLGRDDDDVLNFVDNVVKYQNGERICLNDINGDDVENDSNLAITNRNEMKMNPKRAPDEEEAQQSLNEQRRLEEEKRKQDLEKKQKEDEKLKERLRVEQQKELDRIQNERKINEKKRGSSSKKSEIPTTQIKKQIDNIVAKNKSNNIQKSEKKAPALPKQGKATFICGCFGTTHKPLINCLYCGRIACSKEGFGYCPFCSYLIEEQRIMDGEAFEKAMLHKERLLQFDRDSASRTQVYDSQSDYFANSRSNWLTEKEQLESEMKEEERRKELHSRKQILELDI